MNEIVMPKLSDTMTEGRIVSWKKRVGEAVRRGDVLAEVETDKANMELEAFASGVLLEIRVQSGELAQVGTVIAVIGKAEEKAAQAAPPEAAAPKAEPAAAAPEPEAVTAAPKAEPAAAAPKSEAAPKTEAGEPAAVPPKGEPAAAAKGAGREPPLEEAMELGGFQAREPAAATEEKPPTTEEKPAATPPGTAPPGERQGEAAPHEGGAAEREAAGGAEAERFPGQLPTESRERAAPVVRRRARELGIDLGQVKGSGPEGRILLQDLESYHPEPVPGESGRPAAPVVKGAAETGPKPLSRLRAAIAKTVTESWNSIPHFSVTMDILMDDAEALRRQLKQSGMPVTLNDVVVKGVSRALQAFPQLNASFVAGGIQLHSEINIGIAVGVPDGVLMPVVSGCQHLSLLEISQAGRGLVERARAGSLTEQEMSGGTFSVSNLGMYGVSEFNAIIYPSQAAVLAVGAVVDAAVVRAGVPAGAKLMKVTLSADHRLADGAYAAAFLVELKGILENPVRLLL
ncbi:MAG: branched-chain alpha-keto acid dehydrogenase subunit E2 [Geobacteraceae bacterium GWC2_58_44]|nr:MAG: branched-chain alpha-keto acid dehydrogenase subunit E2 [Geobacteraceae bacterium GWC2_58_44]HBG05814.1 branched-chain alpha-keto acid dehydrogenase subunit E2 [Geobacter sp.]